MSINVVRSVDGPRPAEGRTRVAAVQYGVTTDVDANLATALRFVDAAAAEGAQVVVLPEFGNHVSWYDDREHARRMAVTLDGPYVKALADSAASHVVVAHGELRRRPRGRAHHRHQPALLARRRARGHQRQAGAHGVGAPAPRRRGRQRSDRRDADRPLRHVLVHGRRHQRDAARPRRTRGAGAAQQPELVRARRGLAAHPGARAREPRLDRGGQQGRAAGASRHDRAGQRRGRRSRGASARRGGEPGRRTGRHGRGDRTAHGRGDRGGRHRRRPRRRQGATRRHGRDALTAPGALRAPRRRADGAGRPGRRCRARPWP